ncbi:hypothetical protein Tco_1049805 [Tanacetum coccineum]
MSNNRLERFGEELQTKTPKRLKEEKDDEAKDDESTKKSEREESQMSKKRIVMNRYGMDGPEDKLEKGFWKCLRIMFEEPLSTDSIWSEIGQQKIISWRYYDTLGMKLLDGKMSEDCYRLLKMMEKQAGIRNIEVEGLKAKI